MTPSHDSLGNQNPVMHKPGLGHTAAPHTESPAPSLGPSLLAGQHTSSQALDPPVGSAQLEQRTLAARDTSPLPAGPQPQPRSLHPDPALAPGLCICWVWGLQGSHTDRKEDVWPPWPCWGLPWAPAP